MFATGFNMACFVLLYLHTKLNKSVYELHLKLGTKLVLAFYRDFKLDYAHTNAHTYTHNSSYIQPLMNTNYSTHYSGL